MRLLQLDLSVFKEFRFERQPVGVKYLFDKPDGIVQLKKPLGLCEMPKEAQNQGAPFYMTRENEDCAGVFPLGMGEIPPCASSGKLGPALEIFNDDRANRRLYERLPRIWTNTVNYVVFSPLDKLTFDPDLLMVFGTARQAEVIMRAMSYSTGEIWGPKMTPVMACAWLFAYPYISGKVNYSITGMCFGGISREVHPEGQVMISIPYNWLPTIVENLKEMKWILPSYNMGREAFVDHFHALLGSM